MDNLSHSVVGLAAGEFIHRSLKTEAGTQQQGVRRRLLLLSCWLASNFPDLDLVLTPLLPRPLGYLLHHRGHTHTLLYALPQAILIFGLLWLFWPSARQLLRESRHARLGLVLSLCCGLLLHLMMDSLNSYGIHPFYPVDARWFYGDMVFILEPVFWVGFGVPLAMMIGQRWIRNLLLAVLGGSLLLFTAKGFLLWSSLGALFCLGLLLAMAQFRSGRDGRGGLALATLFFMLFLGAQALASREGKQAVARNLQAMDAGSQVLDVAMTPFPGNPLCWNFVSVESNESAGTYRLSRGALGLLPNLLPVTQCPPGLLGSNHAATGQLALEEQIDGSLATLRRLKNDNCYFEAWLRFARMPVVVDGNATDVRFAASPRGNFTTLPLDGFARQECPKHVPGWGFPRADLLHPAPTH